VVITLVPEQLTTPVLPEKRPRDFLYGFVAGLIVGGGVALIAFLLH